MGERITDALTTRRRLGGAVLLLAGLVIGLVVLWPGGDKPAAKKNVLPIRIVSVPNLGFGFAHPTAWKRNVTKQVIGVRSPDGSILVFLASPLAGSAVARVKAEAEIQLLKQFKPAKIVSERPQPLGKRNVASFELLGKDKGKTVRALEMIDSTQYRTYAVTVVTGPKPSRQLLREARAIIGTVRFTKPTALASKG
jgi:hypothetical protein